MKLLLGISLALSFASSYCNSDVVTEPVSLYSYFTSEGVGSGLTAQNNQFNLNGKDLKILSGSLHYFRVHPSYWRLRLQQYKAAGLNTVDVYVPWNLHEPQRDEFDFGTGDSQFSPFLNLTRFVEMIKEEDMFAIFRAGPYICGEWEFGGLPSWLLHEHPMFVRTSFGPYQERAEIYLKQVIAQVKDLQFYTAEGSVGGPIIMAQIENEYGNFGYGDHPRDKQHLKFLKNVMIQEGIESLLFTSDTPTLTADWGNIDGELMTANFKWGSEDELLRIKELRPDSPILVTEFWPGWFDHWFEENHNILKDEDFRIILGNIFGANGSVNFYMFHGGTNFGYMNGANILGYNGIEVKPGYAPDGTSYDYDAPISESGQYNDKYFSTLEMIMAYDPLYSQLTHPAEPPAVVGPRVYPEVLFQQYLPYWDLLEQVPDIAREVHVKPTAMEQLNINNENGQSYGYIIYRKEVQIKWGSLLKVRGHSRDLMQVLINGVQVNEPIVSAMDLGTKFGSWGLRDSEYLFLDHLEGCETLCTLDIMVENLGRVNFGSPHNYQALKGLWEGDVLLDNVILEDWEHIAVEMKPQWLEGLHSWQPFVYEDNLQTGPRLLRGNLDLGFSNEVEEWEGEEMQDTFFDYDCSEGCQDWLHGTVFVNGFNIGRYYQAGPQKSLYIPGPLLKPGDNEILVFENYLGSDRMKFTDQPNYGEPINFKDYSQYFNKTK